MIFFDKNKMSFWTRIKLCFRVLVRGNYNPEDYKTRGAQRQWIICENRRRELEKTVRPATPYKQAPVNEWD
jgi:hypothetical protein